MTHGLNIKPHERECVCPAFWTQFDGHSPACELKYGNDFMALVADVKAKAANDGKAA